MLASPFSIYKEKKVFKNFYLRVVVVFLFTTILCSYFGQVLLLTIEYFQHYWKYLIYFTPAVLLLTKFSNKYIKTEKVGMKYFIEATNESSKKVSWYFPIVLTFNTLLAHAFGVSVGREGVAVQLGGAIGTNLTNSEMSKKQRSFLIRLGMIAGFSSLFQTPLAAVFFILEITKRYKKISLRYISECTMYFLSAIVATKLSHKLGLEKFFVEMKLTEYSITAIGFFKILVLSVIFILVGMFFVIVQKYLKKIVNEKEGYRWILLCAFIVVSIIFDYRYSSLGTNLISFSYSSDQIMNYDFILKLILTALCTAIGFSGGEVTPLFAIGASLGIILGNFLGLPILLSATLGYILVFSAATRTFITPAFLALEVFGMGVAFIIVIPAFLIYLINRRYSIYN